MTLPQVWFDMASSPLPPPLNRRSSYDPHSTKTKLSLGSLPPPSFRDLGAGQRSVPAVESSRHLGGFRAVSSPFGDGLRTPGGSLVVGSEVFGFGRAAALAAKEGKDRWGDGLTGEGESEDPPTPSGVPKDSPSSDWPSAFEKASYAATDFQLAQDALGKNKALNGVRSALLLYLLYTSIMHRNFSRRGRKARSARNNRSSSR